MIFSIAVLPEEVLIRRLPNDGPDPDVWTVSTSLIHPGQHYGTLSYEDLRSLGDGLWDLPGDPFAWTTAKARRIEIQLPGPDADPTEAASDPVSTT